MQMPHLVKADISCKQDIDLKTPREHIWLLIRTANMWRLLTDLLSLMDQINPTNHFNQIVISNT